MADETVDVAVGKDGSTAKTTWSQWVISASGKHHLTRPGHDRTKCNQAIEPGWVRVNRTEVLPPPTSDPKEKRAKKMCAGCTRRGRVL